MSGFAELIPIVAIVSSAVVALSWMKFRHEREKWTNDGDRGERTLLERDNARLLDTVDRLEQRIAVLEQIATDPAQRTAREIEQLRQQ